MRSNSGRRVCFHWRWSILMRLRAISQVSRTPGSKGSGLRGRSGPGGDAAQPARPGAGDREGHASDTPHFEAESVGAAVVRVAKAPGGEISARRSVSSRLILACPVEKGSGRGEIA